MAVVGDEMKDFEKALAFTLKWEGGYSNDPRDPGGETNFGISKRSYPHEDIKGMTLERATKIYYENYWIKAKCDMHCFPMNIILFDTAVNCGRTRARKLLYDYNWQEYLLRRIAFYSKCKGAKTFLRGWVNRVISLYEYIKNT